MTASDLAAAAEAVELARRVVDTAARHLAELAADGAGRVSVDGIDRHQVLAYDLAHAASGIEGSGVMLEYARHGELEAMLGCLFAAEAITDLVGDGRLLRFGVRFTAQVWPGDTLTVRITVDRLGDEGGGPVAELSIETVNQDGKAVITGYAVARLDS